MTPMTLPELQDAVETWVDACFGLDLRHRPPFEPVNGSPPPEIVARRVHRFIEEAAELAQAVGVEQADIERIVAHVYSRPPGDLPREVAGSLTTLSALASALGVRLQPAVLEELNRMWMRMDAIRERDKGKDAIARGSNPLN